MTINRVIRFGIVVVLCLCASSVQAQMSKEDVRVKFEAANQKYQEAMYKEAIKLYEAILSGGRDSAAIYYNLGNAYKKQNELGRAVLNYERALILKPRDADIKANYKFVLKEARVSRKIEGGNIIQRQMQKHIDFYSFDEMLFIITCLVLVVGLLFLFKSKFEGRTFLYGLSYVIVAVLLTAHVFGFVMKLSDFKAAGIVLSSTDARYEPRVEAVTHYHIHQGEKVKIDKTLGAWVKVERKDKKLGWIEKKDIEKILQ